MSTAKALTAIYFRDELTRIVTNRGASLRLGFKGRFAYLQAQWPGAEDALRLLRAQNYDVVRYLTEQEESELPDSLDDDFPRLQRLQAERAELAFIALEMRSEIDALVQATGARPRLTNDSKRAWICVHVEGEWMPVIRCRKGAAPERLNVHAAMTAARPNTAAICRGERRIIPASKACPA